MFVSFNMRFRAVAATTKNEWGNCHKQWARKVAAQKAIIMKLLGFFLLLLAVLHSPYPTSFWTLFPVTISRFLAHDSRVLQLKFIYFYCFCSFWARIYSQRNIYLYIGIYICSKSGQFCDNFIPFYFLLNGKCIKRIKKKYRALSCSHFANENVEEIIYFFAHEDEEKEKGKRQRTRGNILSYFALNFNRI